MYSVCGAIIAEMRGDGPKYNTQIYIIIIKCTLYFFIIVMCNSCTLSRLNMVQYYYYYYYHHHHQYHFGVWWLYGRTLRVNRLLVVVMVQKTKKKKKSRSCRRVDGTRNSRYSSTDLCGWMGGWSGVSRPVIFFFYIPLPAPRLCASFDLFIFPPSPPPPRRVSDYNRRLDFRLHTMTTTDDAKWCVAAVAMCVRRYLCMAGTLEPATTGIRSTASAGTTVTSLQWRYNMI